MVRGPERVLYLEGEPEGRSEEEVVMRTYLPYAVYVSVYCGYVFWMNWRVWSKAF